MPGTGFDPNQPRERNGRFEVFKATVASGSLVVPPESDSGSLRPLPTDPGTVASRRIVLTVLDALSEHREALNLLGGHTVMEITRDVPDLPEEDSTKDGDVGVLPAFLADFPLIADRMAELGFETAREERPGIWTPISQRDADAYRQDSVDLIAPYAISYPEGTRKPRRAARVGEHGVRAVMATQGTELASIDRVWMSIRSFDDGPDGAGYVAGPSALLCAKAYKLGERLADIERRPGRVLVKDFGDTYRLLRAIEPEEASEVFSRGERTDRIGDAVALGRQHLLNVLGHARTPRFVADWIDDDNDDARNDFVVEWRERFRQAR